MRPAWLRSWFLSLGAISAVLPVSAEGAGAPIGQDIVATVGDGVVTAAELDDLARERLVRLRAEEYRIKRAVLDETISRLLLEGEAKARGVTVRQLEEAEIEAKAAILSPEVVRRVFESNGQRYQGRDEAAALAEIGANLRSAQMAEIRRKFVASLKKKAGVRILLEPPRVEVRVDIGPSKGPATAPVTVVEFADFQCPACRSAHATFLRVLEKYGDQVRFVFRHFPLPIHKEAPKAAEAASCANEQGRFWEMHDRLFQAQGGLQPSDLRRHAQELQLEMARFDACLESGKFLAAWQRDLADGRRYGVAATPTFFVNGRSIQGSQPFEAFAEILDEELAKASGAGSRDQ
ncbi:MAG: thioredoxin domain-containing protein [Vicinamibacteria bacterium]